MSNYKFLTKEGYTYQPDSESIEPDCENCQVIGISNGKSQEEAFDNLLKEKEYLKEYNFDEIYCYKIDKDFEKSRKNFYIKSI